MKISLREKFLVVFECTSGITGKALSDDILKKLENDWKPNMEMFWGQGYDDAGSMAGKRREVLQHEVWVTVQKPCTYILPHTY